MFETFVILCKQGVGVLALSETFVIKCQQSVGFLAFFETVVITCKQGVMVLALSETFVIKCKQGVGGLVFQFSSVWCQYLFSLFVFVACFQRFLLAQFRSA